MAAGLCNCWARGDVACGGGGSFAPRCKRNPLWRIKSGGGGASPPIWEDFLSPPSPERRIKLHMRARPQPPPLCARYQAACMEADLGGGVLRCLHGRKRLPRTEGNGLFQQPALAGRSPGCGSNPAAHWLIGERQEGLFVLRAHWDSPPSPPF